MNPPGDLPTHCGNSLHAVLSRWGCSATQAAPRMDAVCPPKVAPSTAGFSHSHCSVLYTVPSPHPSPSSALDLTSGSSCPGSTVSRTGCNLPYQGGQANVDMCADTFPLGRLSVCVEASLGGQGGRPVRWSEALHLLGLARVPLVPCQGCLLPTRWNQPSGRLHCSSPIGHITALSQSFCPQSAANILPMAKPSRLAPRHHQS